MVFGLGRAGGRARWVARDGVEEAEGFGHAYASVTLIGAVGSSDGSAAPQQDFPDNPTRRGERSNKAQADRALGPHWVRNAIPAASAQVHSSLSNLQSIRTPPLAGLSSHP